jgi:hypothetical protein
MIVYEQELRTRSTLPHLFRGNREDAQHFDHNLHDYVRHCLRRFHCRIGLKTLEEFFDAIEEIDQGVLARFNILGYL